MRAGAVLLGLMALAPVALLGPGGPHGDGLALQEVPSPPDSEREEATATLLLVEVLPHAPRDDEYVIIANPGPVAVNPSGWTLTDREGSWILPSLLLAGGSSILVARNATALWEDAGLRAHACVRGCDRPLTVRGSLALRNQGDGLELFDPEGRLVDAFLFGEESGHPGWVGDPVAGLTKGLVARRRMGEVGWLDTDTSADWTWNRTFRLGQSRRLPASFEVLPVRPLLSPDDSLEGLLALLGSAQRRIELAGFTLTNPAISEALREALGRGVRVQIAVEGSPPGGIGPLGEGILDDLRRDGAWVLQMGAHGEGAWRRYALHHAKYLVIDESWVVAGSENFSPNGYPAEAGNRGWGVAVRGPALARYFRDVLREDWDEDRSDVRSLSAPGGPGEHAAQRPTPMPRTSSLPRADVTVHLGPDNAVSAEGLLGVLTRARQHIDVELFYLRWMWGERLNPLVAGLLDAGNRGVAVRILLDGQPYNTRGDEDNDEAVRRMNRLASEGGLPLEARIFPGDPDSVVKLHNKGLLVDGTQVWVSSMNWNQAGAYANREVGLLVDSREVARVFQRAFEDDWHRGVPLGTAPSPGGPQSDTFLWIGLGSGAAAGAWWWVLRTTKEATNKHPRKSKTWSRRSKRPNSPSRRGNSKSTRTAR